MRAFLAKRLVGAIALASAALPLVTLNALAQDAIKIGASLSITGPASFLGDPEAKTLELYVKQVNEAGGVLGRKLEAVIYDDGADANKARTNVKRLIEEDKVDLIIGMSTTGTTMAVVPIVEEAELPLISLAGAVVIIEPVKKWVFKTPHTDRMACGKIFDDMKKSGITKIGMIYGAGGFDKSMRQECLGIASQYAIAVLADETYGPKDTDMTVQLTKIKNTPGVQAVLNPGFGEGPAIVTKNMRQISLGVPLYQSHGVASKKFIELAGAAAEGVRLPAAALLVADKLPATDPQKATVVSYKKTYEEAFGSAVSTFGGHMYDGLFMAIEAIKRAGGTDRARVRAELEKTKGFMGTGGEFNMSPADHLGLDLSAFRMLEIRNGDWSLLN